MPVQSSRMRSSSTRMAVGAACTARSRSSAAASPREARRWVDATRSVTSTATSEEPAASAIGANDR